MHYLELDVNGSFTRSVVH